MLLRGDVIVGVFFVAQPTHHLSAFHRDPRKQLRQRLSERFAEYFAGWLPDSTAVDLLSISSNRQGRIGIVACFANRFLQYGLPILAQPAYGAFEGEGAQ